MGCTGGSSNARKADKERPKGIDLRPRQEVECLLSRKLVLFESPNPKGVGTAEPPGKYEPEPGVPLAGIEIELQEVQVLDLSQARPRHETDLPLWNCLTSEQEGPQPEWRPKNPKATLRAQRLQALQSIYPANERASKQAFFHPKGTVIFYPPHRSWLGTFDTIGTYDCRIEIITSPFSSRKWESGEVQADLQVLQAVFAWFEDAAEDELVPLSELGASVNGLSICKPGAFFYKKPHLPTRLAQYFQITRQIPIAQALQRKPRIEIREDLLHGMNRDALELTLQTVRHLAVGAVKKSNPKDTFDELLKTPLHLSLGLKEPIHPDEHWVSGWVQEMAILGRVQGRLRDVNALALFSEQWSEDTEMALRPAGFTWDEFFRALLRKQDLLADWSANGFVNGENFGYGTRTEAWLQPGCAVFEDRSLGRSGTTYRGIASMMVLLDQWREAMK